MIKMMLCSILPLFLLMHSTSATFPDLPDFNSMMPNLLSMVPISGQIKLNDQVFNLGADATSTTPSPNNNAIPLPISQMISQVPRNPTNFPNGLSPLSNVGMRATNNIPVPPISNTQIPNNIPFSSASNRNSRMGSFGSGVSNFGAQNPNLIGSGPRIPNFNTGPSIANFNSVRNNPNLNSLPNIRSTDISSTFENTKSSNFRDEFSDPSSPPFGFPANRNQINPSQSNNPNEDPLVVMPLVVSPDRLFQNPNRPVMVPGGTLMTSATNINERHIGEGFESMRIVRGPMADRRQQMPSNNNKREPVKVTRVRLPASSDQTIRTETIFDDSNMKSDLTEVTQRVSSIRLPEPIIKPINTKPVFDDSSVGTDFVKVTRKVSPVRLLEPTIKPINTDSLFGDSRVGSDFTKDTRKVSQVRLPEPTFKPIKSESFFRESSDGSDFVKVTRKVSPVRLLEPTTKPIKTESLFDNPSAVPEFVKMTRNIAPIRLSSTKTKDNGNNFQFNNPSIGSDNVKVTRKVTSIRIPEPTITVIRPDSIFNEKDREELEQHLPPVIPSSEPQSTVNFRSNTNTHKFEDSLIPIKYDASIFKNPKMPTLAELDKQLADRRLAKFEKRTSSSMLSKN